MISVVIPSYNRRACILALLRDLSSQSHAEFEVIVVDDCSRDGSPEAIAAQFPHVQLLQNITNGGPAVSRNRGILAAKGEWIVGLDSDVTVPDATFLDRVQETFTAHPEATGLAFRLLKPDGISEDAARWWHPVPLTKGADRSFETSYFSGTGYAFRRQEVIEAGLFPEILYMHYEEVELAFRIMDQGGRIFHCPHLPVLHHANEVSRRSEVKVYYKPRNQILIALRCYPVLRALAYLTPRLVKGAGTAAAGGHLRDWFRAMRSAYQLGRPSLNSRRVLKPATWERIRSLPGQNMESSPRSNLSESRSAITVPGEAQSLTPLS